MEVWLEEIIPLLLITLRITGFMVAAPITGSRYIPGLIKGTVSLLLGYILWPVVQAGPVPATLGGVVGAAVSEVAVGLLLGFCGNIIMAAIETAGYLVDMKIGFGMANVVNPHYGQASPILGIFKYLLVMLIFLGIDGHHILVRALHRSFQLVPAGAAAVPAEWAQIGLGAAAEMFKIALVLSCPVWAATMIVDFGLGVIARTVPQLNVFVVGIPMKTLVGLGILSASVGFYGVFAKEITLSMQRLLEGLLGVMGR
ncbi:MAG: flagellar biosynthetic protein FliR [Firmicutes bacterium]|nr:flagellar biosynthetic protein FliR [Candidatus Fermentithermobacillaceae bacterium]